jgi:hypothetical protein
MSETKNRINGPLELNESYRHFDSLSWQLPSWGIAITSGVIFAANEIGKGGVNGAWMIPTRYVQAAVLALGGILMTALSLGLLRYREFQAATVPTGFPSPPFGRPPRAAKFLQFSMFLMSGTIVGLAGTQLLSCSCFLSLFIIVYILTWFVAERHLKKEIAKINESFDIAVKKK